MLRVKMKLQRQPWLQTLSSSSSTPVDIYSKIKQDEHSPATEPLCGTPAPLFLTSDWQPSYSSTCPDFPHKKWSSSSKCDSMHYPHHIDHCTLLLPCIMCQVMPAVSEVCRWPSPCPWLLTREEVWYIILVVSVCQTISLESLDVGSSYLQILCISREYWSSLWGDWKWPRVTICMHLQAVIR